MKAAIMYQQGGGPRYAEVPSPVATKEDEIVMTVRATAIKHVDRRGQASGNHYSANAQQASQAKIIDGDGVVLLADGTRVYAIGVGGMVAQQAVVEKDRMVWLSPIG